MTMSLTQQAITILTVVLGTLITRFLPFIVFPAGKPTPKYLVVYQLGGLITGEVGFNFFTVVAVVIVAAFLYLMFRPNKYVNDNEVKIDVSKIK